MGHSEPVLSLVMPCYNEETGLRKTATELLTVFAERNIPLQLVLVDNGSSDRTGAIIDELIQEGRPVTKVTVPVNRGYGDGLLQGLKACRAPWMGYLCADGEVPPESALTAYRNALASPVPVLAKARRKIRKDSWRRKLVSAIYNFGIPLLFGWLGSVDLNASPKIMRREVFRAMRLESCDWFLDPELMIKAKHLRLKVVENVVEGRFRAGGKSNVRWSTCLEFVRNLLRYRFGGAFRQWKQQVRHAATEETDSSVAPANAGTGSCR